MTMTTTIVHLTYSLGFGGLEQVIVNLINSSQNYDVNHVIISLKDELDLVNSIEANVTVHTLNKKDGNDFSSHINLFKLLRRIKPDVIQTYNFGTIEYHLTSKLAGVKKQVHSDHGRGGDHSNGLGRKQNLLRKVCAKVMDYYIVVSPDLYEWGKKTLKLDIKQLKLIFNGVDVERYQPKDKQKTPNSYESFSICTVGRAHPIKNQSLLIRAFLRANELNEKFSTAHLTIVGDGPILNELRAEVTALGLDHRILLPGYRKDIPKIMQDADLFVLSSDYEAMPMTILEAMACELPVICTDVGGARYLLSDEEGWLVGKGDEEAMAEAMLACFSDQNKAKKKSLAGRKKVIEKYSIENMVDEYMALYGATKL